MLFNPEWEQKTKADPFELGTLIAWLEKQPAAKRYSFADCAGCALQQYFSAHGFEDVNMGPRDFDHGPIMARQSQSLPQFFNEIVNDRQQTFGAALDRARAAAAR